MPEADFGVPMEAVLDLYSQPYDARYPVIGRDEQSKPLRADQWTPPPARPGRLATYACGAAPAPSWLCVEPLPVAYGQRHCAAPGRGLGAPGAGPRGSSARPPGQAPDPGLRPSERPCLRLFLPGVYAPARPLAPQGRAGIERPDAAGPDPTQGTAWAEARHAAQKGIHWRLRTADARVRLKHLNPAIKT